MRDDLSIIKFLETLHNRIDDTDDNSFDNTIIQFFEAPHDNATLTALILAYVNGANIPISPQDTETLTALINAQVTDPATLTWGGYDGGGVFHNAGWAWGFGAAWGPSSAPIVPVTLSQMNAKTLSQINTITLSQIP